MPEGRGKEKTMNKYKKFFFVFLCTTLIEAVFIIVLLAQRGETRKNENKYQQENTLETVSLPRRVEPSKPKVTLQPKGTTQQTLPPQTEQPKTQKIPEPIEKSGERSKRAITSAILRTLGQQSKADEISEEKLVDSTQMLLDKTASLKDRRQAVWTLAKNGSNAALAELEKAFWDNDTPTYLKAAIVEALGYSPSPRGKELIFTALENDDDAVACAAIRGLSAIGDEEAVSTLSNIVLSTNESSNVLSEAALGLGNIDSPSAYNALVNAYYKTTPGNTDLKEDIITALGQRDIAETGEFLQKILDENTANPSLRLAIVEAVEDAKGDTSSFLLRNLHDKDSEVRAEAAWALAVADEPGNIAEELQKLLLTEKDAEVRKRLYQALDNQESANIDAAAQIIFQETDSDARLAGYDFLAKNLALSASEYSIEQFEKIAVPELREAALTAKNSNTRLGAVITLKRANTTESYRALEEISAKSTDMKVIKAIGN